MENTKHILKLGNNSKFNEANIYRLSELKPAGTKLILEPDTDLIELIKLTLFDLILKQVLVVKKELKKSHPRDPHFREYTIVETGKNFAKYEPCTFENYFLSRIDEDSYFILKSYLRVIYKEIPSEYRYKKEIVEGVKLEDLFKSNVMLSILSLLKTNQKGEELRKDITEYLTDVDATIGGLIKREPQKALEIILFLKGNIFLLKNLKFESLERLKIDTSITGGVDNEHSDWFWMDYLYYSDGLDSDFMSEVSDVFDTIDDYFDFDNGVDWGGGDDDFDYGFDFD
ncbi:hypothetical protein M0D21_15470 [Aquimarina sp. D1M17]|uniref:hypothetical protein n=1 Tax=Aquimarina acroporae TaxID=2937283 RepID=UPI0020BD543C|nr:hypothetical protein [Aquimarina acroporae]MCK8522976.1 hypothetical protein [Aquimarina acroporae]